MPPKKRASDVDTDAQTKRKKKSKGAQNGGTDPLPSPLEDDNSLEIIHKGSDIEGTVLVCGGTNWDLIGRNSLPKGVKSSGGRNLWGPHRLNSLSGIAVRTVAAGCTACHSVLLTTEGKAYSWGRNEKGQLGHGDTVRRDNPTLMESLAALNIVDASCGKNHTLMLDNRGRVYAVGDNKMGQLGLGTQSQSVPSPTRIQYTGPPIKRTACGAEFSMIADVRGNLYSFGCPEYGQLGHNSDGKFFVSSNKLTFHCETKPRKVQVFIEKNRDNHVNPVPDVQIIDVACGTNHTIVVDHKKRVFTWGFGGYGRLGHSEQKDEWVPRMLKAFDSPNKGAIMVQAGASFTMAVSELGALYLWGQNKPTGEAAMYPKLVQDLSGWQVRSIGCCNRSIIIAADQSVISWGPSPTYGELGYGDSKPRSSTTPQEVKSLNGMHIYQVATGYGHTVMIARDETEEDKEKLKKLPTFCV